MGHGWALHGRLYEFAMYMFGSSLSPMIFFDISADQVAILGKETNILVPYDDLERNLPTAVHEIYTPKTFDTVRVLNGPGGFTILRIGCLVLNTLQMTSDHALQFFSSSKLDLYAFCIRQGVMPAQGLIFIGQKKNMWHARFDLVGGTWHYEIVPQTSFHDLFGDKEYFVDHMYAHSLQELLPHENMLGMKFDGTYLQVTWQDKKIQVTPADLGLSPIDYLQPNYLIDPQIY